MRRGQLRRRTPLTGDGTLERGGRLRQVSDRRRAGADEYRAAKEAVWYRDRGECQAERLVPEVTCAGKRDPHHVWPQGRYPERRADPDAMIVLCRAHHDWVHHEQPARAYEMGLLA